MADKKQTTGYSGPYRGKNDYYRDGAYMMTLVVNIQAGLIFLLTLVFSVYLCLQENHDRYFAETADGKIMPMSGLHLPNMGRMALSSWAATAASQIMTFGFNDIDTSFAQSRKYFTADGWDSFKKAVMKSKLIDSIMATQQIATAVPLTTPTLKQDGLMMDGNEGWVFDVPLLVTFRAGGDIRPSQKTVHMVIEKMPTRENPNGVGISEWTIN
jgi:intracellular multiplication protein IcmL